MKMRIDDIAGPQPWSMIHNGPACNHVRLALKAGAASLMIEQE
jgi:hypothetical protein